MEVRALQGDAADLGELLPGGGADLVLCHSVLEYVEDPVGAMTAMAGLLRAGGVISVLAANPLAAALHRAFAGRFDEAHQVLDDPEGRWGDRDPTPRRFTREALERCRWEHVMSEQVERRLLEMLDHPTESPYGNPIPGLDELGETPAERFMDGVINLVKVTTGQVEPVTGIIRRLAEPVQFEPELLQQLASAGVRPGGNATISAAGSYIAVQVDGYGEGLELPIEVAQHIYVERKIVADL